MKRTMLSAALFLFAGLVFADDVRVLVVPKGGEPKVIGKPGEPIQVELFRKDFQPRGEPGKPPQGNSNAELIALLKKAIQILEAQGGQPPVRAPLQWQKLEDPRAHEEMAKRMKELHMRLQQHPKADSPDVARAREAMQMAEKQLAQAKETLARVLGGQGGQPKPEPPPAARSAELEKRLDMLMRELEEIRREMKRQK